MRRWQDKLICMAAVIAMIMLAMALSCAVDDATGRRMIDPNAASTGEHIAEAARDALPFAGPIGGIAAGVLASMLAYWRKIKPQIVAQKSKSAQYQQVASETVSAIDKLKTASPDAWAALKKLLEDAQGAGTATYRTTVEELRGQSSVQL